MLKSRPPVMVKALAPGLKIISETSITPVCEIAVMFEASNVAVSLGSSGTVLGVQLVAVFQLPLVGLRFQVALPAKAGPAIRHEKRQSAGKSFFMLRSQQKTADISS